MTKTVLNVKTDVDVKRQAQNLAKEMGVPLSVIVNANLKQFISERRFTIQAPLVPNKRLAKILDKAEKDWNKGKRAGSSPIFTTGEEMDAWLRENV